LVGVVEEPSRWTRPSPVEVDTMQHKVDMLAERSLVFVACARARDDLYVS
jgi:hypothetical protein